MEELRKLNTMSANSTASVSRAPSFWSKCSLKFYSFLFHRYVLAIPHPDMKGAENCGAD